MKESGKWSLHIFFAIIILFLLGLHMIIMHLDSIVGIFSSHGGSAVSWQNVKERSQSAFFLVFYIVLLGAALYHGLYGLRNIVFELSLKKKTEKVVSFFILLFGVVLFAFGTYAAVVIYLMKTA